MPRTNSGTATATTTFAVRPKAHNRRSTLLYGLWAALLFSPSTAWAVWGEGRWGEMTWGDLLPQVPVFGPLGLGLLTTITVGAGMYWGRRSETLPPTSEEEAG